MRLPAQVQHLRMYESRQEVGSIVEWAAGWNRFTPPSEPRSFSVQRRHRSCWTDPSKLPHERLDFPLRWPSESFLHECQRQLGRKRVAWKRSSSEVGVFARRAPSIDPRQVANSRIIGWHARSARATHQKKRHAARRVNHAANPFVVRYVAGCLPVDGSALCHQRYYVAFRRCTSPGRDECHQDAAGEFGLHRFRVLPFPAQGR
jgi:hypothetical protein